MIVPNRTVRDYRDFVQVSESLLNRLWNNREHYDIQGANADDLRRTSERLKYMIQTTEDLLRETTTITLHAAE